MKQNILEELEEMKYLLGYKRGKVISEQTIPANITGLKTVQDTLKSLGYTEVGDIDGKIGPKTLGALTKALTDLKGLKEKPVTPTAGTTTPTAGTTTPTAGTTIPTAGTTTPTGGEIGADEFLGFNAGEQQTTPAQPTAPQSRKDLRRGIKDLRQQYKQRPR